MARTMLPEVNQRIRKLISDIDKLRTAVPTIDDPFCKDVMMAHVVKKIKELEQEYEKLQEQRSAP